MATRFSFAPVLILAATLLLTACGSSQPAVQTSAQAEAAATTTDYKIGAGDQLQVFVWRNPDLSMTVPVRPDGKVSTPLVEDMQAVGKTPSQLSRDMEVELSKYIKSPKVNIIVTGFVGAFGEQIRVVGKAASPQSLPYRDGMTLLDVIIEVGGLAPGAAGNRAKILRRYPGQSREIDVRIYDLVNKGKLEANVAMMPGDVLIIPESRF